MKFKAVHALLVVGSFVTLVLSLSALTGSGMYVQFSHLLQSSPPGTPVAAGQSQPSNNPTLQSSSSSFPLPSTSSSLPDVFEKVENSSTNY